MVKKLLESGIVGTVIEKVQVTLSQEKSLTERHKREERIVKFKYSIIYIYIVNNEVKVMEISYR